MFSDELAKVCQFLTAFAHTVPVVASADSSLTIAIVLSPVIAFLPPHEGARVLLELLADFGMLLQIFLQRRMVLDPRCVIDQRRILTQLLRDIRMAVQEPVHAPQFPPGRVIIALSPLFPPFEPF